MTLPLVSPFTDGTFVNKGQLDLLVSAINTLNNLILTTATHATFTNVGGQSIPNNVFTVVTGWTAAETAGMGAYSAGVQTILTAGIYIITGSVSYPAAASATQRAVRLYVNATLVSEYSARSDTAYNVTLPIAHSEYFNAGDTISVQTVQLQGSSQALCTGAGLNHLAITYTGA